MPTLLQVDLCNSMAPVPTRTAQEMEELQLLGVDMHPVYSKHVVHAEGWLARYLLTYRADISRAGSASNVCCVKVGWKSGMSDAWPRCAARHKHGISWHACCF